MYLSCLTVASDYMMDDWSCDGCHRQADHSRIGRFDDIDPKAEALACCRLLVALFGENDA